MPKQTSREKYLIELLLKVTKQATTCQNGLMQDFSMSAYEEAIEFLEDEGLIEWFRAPDVGDGYRLIESEVA